MSDTAVESLRVPPHSNEAEQAVLGGLLLDNEAWIPVSERINEDDFYRNDHRLLFKAVQSLVSNGQPYDAITLREWLAQQGELDNAGGVPYLAALVENTPSAANVAAYADIVRERSILRQLIQVATQIAGDAYRPGERSSAQVLDAAEQAIFQIAEQELRGRRTYKVMKDLLVTALDRIDKLFHRDNPITGVPTGFLDLDDLTSGLQPSDLVIVAGRPSMGKTAFALNVAEAAALKENLTVAVFSMEMPAEQLVMRMMSSLGRIDQHRMRTGKLDDNDWPRLTDAVGRLDDAKIVVDDTPSLTPGELRNRCRRIAREHGLGMVVVDYLQLMQVLGTKENRATEISEISRSLKALAKEMKVPVVALSQLNRSLESRPNKRPMMSDLRESGAIEQDADLILFIYRDEVYDEASPDKGIAEIIVGKQRNGPIGTVRLAFLGQYTRFENFTPQELRAPGFLG